MSEAEKPLLIAMMGLPRSGKSTIVASLSRRLGAPIVRRDAIRLALHGQRFQAKSEPMVKAISLYMIRALFLSGHEVVICDETNYSRATRDSLREAGWRTQFYHVDTSPEVCKKRAVATKQEDLIPIIDSMWARYEPLGDDEEVYNPSYRCPDCFRDDEDITVNGHAHGCVFAHNWVG